MDIDKEEYELACGIAEKAHEGQFRYDGVTPYITHPRQVADQVSGYFAKSIAILHDVIEDCDGYTADTLHALGVDPVVVQAVEVLTHPKEEPYAEYIERVARYGLTAKIKLADMIVNLADGPTEAQKKKYVKYTPILFAVI